eukprot:4292385-Pyramimonas_sp.AAC.1
MSHRSSWHSTLSLKCFMPLMIFDGFGMGRHSPCKRAMSLETRRRLLLVRFPLRSLAAASFGQLR